MDEQKPSPETEPEPEEPKTYTLEELLELLPPGSIKSVVQRDKTEKPRS